jgi:hypothetical protein
MSFVPLPHTYPNRRAFQIQPVPPLHVAVRTATGVSAAADRGIGGGRRGGRRFRGSRHLDYSAIILRRWIQKDAAAGCDGFGSSEFVFLLTRLIRSVIVGRND